MCATSFLKQRELRRWVQDALLLGMFVNASPQQFSALEYNVGLSARTLNVNTVQNLDFCELFYVILTFVF
jgi:hypothetical protein